MVGGSTIKVKKYSGGRKGSRCQRNNRSAVDYGLMMDPVSGSDRNVGTMSGATIS